MIEFSRQNRLGTLHGKSYGTLQSSIVNVFRNGWGERSQRFRENYFLSTKFPSEILISTRDDSVQDFLE